MADIPACPPPPPRSPRRGIPAFACAFLAALAGVLAAAPAEAVVDASQVTLVGADGDPSPWVTSASARAAMPASAASDALLASPMRRASTSAGDVPEHGNPATAQRRRLVVGGLERSYLVQPAPGGRGAGRLPVVVLLHGGAQTAADIWRETSLPTLGASEGFIVVAPEALARQWHDQRNATATVDDVRFLKAVITEVVAQDHGDPSAVFMVGSSHGGFMAMRFACDAGETLRAAASLLSAMPEALARNCKSPRPLPWLAVNGTEDPDVPFGGQVEGTVRHGEIEPGLRSADDSFRFWADRAGCAAPTAREALTDPATDERHRWAERIVRGNCVGGQLSQQVVLHGSGHVIPGPAADNRLAERAVGPAAPEIDGGTLVWMHFKATLLK